jgi:hypothetical protein
VVTSRPDGTDRSDTRSPGLTVNDDSAGPALAEAATKLRAPQLQVIAEDVEQRRGRVDVHLLRAPVDFQCQEAHSASGYLAPGYL